MPFHLVQLSDMHLLADAGCTVLGCPLQPALEAALEAVQERPPDVLLLTGDLSQDGSAASYHRLGALLRPLGVPCYAIPGNHDDAQVMAAALDAPPFRSERSFEAGGWRLLLLDSVLPGKVHGRLSAEALAWLADELEAHAQQPTLIALHHPPVPPGSAWLDPLGLHDPAPLLDLVAAHPQVRLVLFGHIHQAFEARHAQARLYGCPATGFQFEPHADVFTVGRAPAGYRRLWLFPDGRFSTVLERVPYAYPVDSAAVGY